MNFFLWAGRTFKKDSPIADLVSDIFRDQEWRTRYGLNMPERSEYFRYIRHKSNGSYDVVKAAADLRKAYLRRYNRRYIPPSIRFKILSRDCFKCVACGASPADGARLEIDHIIPISKGGVSVESNLQTLCKQCNIGKGGKLQ